MRKLISIFSAIIIAILVLTSRSRAGDNADASGIELRGQQVVGNSLQLIVETSRTYRPVFSRKLETADARGYLIIVDLADNKPLAQRGRVFGPLWDVPNPRSLLSFQAGANFTKEDDEAARATPMVNFDSNGTLLRFTRNEARQAITRDALVIGAQAASWKNMGDLKPVRDDLHPMSEDRLLSLNGRFMLLNKKQETVLIDLFTGDSIDDPWLTTAFRHARSIKDFENVRFFLTDDLKYLVARPQAIWNTGNKILETFELAGKTYKRSDVGLAYSRPDQVPMIFARKLEEGQSFLEEEPHGAFSVNGQLYLFMNDEQSLRLYTPDGKSVLSAKAKDNPRWPTIAYPQLQHDAVENCLLIFDPDDLAPNRNPNETIGVIKWNYQAGKVARYDVRIIDLFERVGGVLRPRSLLSVK